MFLAQFLEIIRFLFNIFFQFWIMIYNIPLTNNIKFGPVLIIFVILFIFIYLMFRPFRDRG